MDKGIQFNYKFNNLIPTIIKLDEGDIKITDNLHSTTLFTNNRNTYLINTEDYFVKYFNKSIPSKITNINRISSYSNSESNKTGSVINYVNGENYVYDSNNHLYSYPANNNKLISSKLECNDQLNSKNISRNSNLVKSTSNKIYTKGINSGLFTYGGNVPKLSLLNNNIISVADNLSYITYMIMEEYISCFMADTQLLTTRGYKAVQDIKVGDILLTANEGETKVTKLLHEIVKGDKKTNPYKIKRGQYGAHLDTYLSGLHMIYDGTNLRQVRDLPDVVQIPMEKIHYYHIETQNKMLDVIYANGLLAETWIEGYPFSMRDSKVYGDIYKQTYLNRFSRKLPITLK
jgi:hypothetical protein